MLALSTNQDCIVLTKNSLLSVIFLLVLRALSAQPTNQPVPAAWCGTHEYSAWLHWYHDHKNELSTLRDLDTAWLYVPVTIHIVGDDNGSGLYPEGETFRILCEMNEQYAPARIRFYFMPGEPFVYHFKSSWYEHNWDGGYEMITTTKIEDRLNCYIVKDPAGNCGYSWIDAIVMGRGCSGPGNSTWAHEAGHHFSLPHPFFGWEGNAWDFAQPAPPSVGGVPVEKMDSSNCFIAGDRFCDTRPDYLSYRWTCTPDKESTVLQKDPNGVAFRSDATLYMGYALDACTGRFTNEQIEAMRANLYTEHLSYLQASSPEPNLQDDFGISYVSPIDSATEQYNNVWLQWAPVPNAEFYLVEVSNSPFFSVVFFSKLVSGTTAVNATKGIPNNRTLYWRVRAFSSWDLCTPTTAQAPAIFRTRNLSSTNELERLAEITLAPNPVNSGAPMVLSINSSESLDLLLTVSDASGRLCHQNRTFIYPGDNRLEIPTYQLEAGFYFVSLQTTQGTLVKRLVITQ